MIYLEKAQKHSVNTERFERKRILNMGQSVEVRSLIKKIGFRKSFNNRIVHSIYFDDLSNTAFRDNIEGNPLRKKIRVRWYNNNIDQACIELKIKKTYLGLKERYLLKDKFNSVEEVMKIASEWCILNVNKYLSPVSYISYFREYYIYDGIRATLDTKVNSKRIFKSLSMAKSKIEYEVLEFKYDRKLDNQFRKLFVKFNPLNLRITKSSKFSNAF
jgi:hypothetical protein